jgi:hypothetical protein
LVFGQLSQDIPHGGSRVDLRGPEQDASKLSATGKPKAKEAILTSEQVSALLQAAKSDLCTMTSRVKGWATLAADAPVIEALKHVASRTVVRNWPA